MKTFLIILGVVYAISIITMIISLYNAPLIEDHI